MNSIKIVMNFNRNLLSFTFSKSCEFLQGSHRDSPKTSGSEGSGSVAKGTHRSYVDRLEKPVILNKHMQLPENLQPISKILKVVAQTSKSLKYSMWSLVVALTPHTQITPRKKGGSRYFWQQHYCQKACFSGIRMVELLVQRIDRTRHHTIYETKDRSASFFIAETTFFFPCCKFPRCRNFKGLLLFSAVNNLRQGRQWHTDPSH